MKRLFILTTMMGLALASVTLAADQKYRADGPIQRLQSDMILVRTTTQDIEIKRDAKTKVSGGEVRRGAVTTVFYTKVNGENVATEIVMGGAPGKPK